MELSAEVGDVGDGGSGQPDFVQDGPPLASPPIHVVSPMEDMDVDGEDSDEEEFVPETLVEPSCSYLLPAPHPIPALSSVRSHYHTLDLDAMQEKNIFSNTAIEKNREGISKMCITHYNKRASVFLFEELEPFEGWSQGSFRSLHFLCRHALAAASVEWGPNVHLVYMQQEVFNVYEVEFPPIPDERFWPKWYGTRLRPNPATRRKSTGIPIFPRFRNEMDEGEHREKRCGLCRETIHTRKGCAN
ncbi:hypothetical protein Ahy_B03g064051 [Arachis hypogaea]|uniref:SWIM-type domain-containing protein n=1 Tax=Arachis hypogaea TaxID=3818 RepID=A0A444ZYN9_ARAHY|nr:hypothetical protein Ahy_B03g064051 [Arachis hypogaea]